MIDLDPRLRVVSLEPLNAETSLPDHLGVLTPSPLIYHRNHFPFPQPPQTIALGGLVGKPRDIPVEELLQMPTRTLTVTMECAGNGRSGLMPAAEGEPWQYGAVSTAEWTGVPLATILEAAEIEPDAQEIVFVGADHGHVAAAGAEISYVRSLPVEKALDPDVLLAVAMNGHALSLERGGPVRLVVPGWYGMASVKWLTRIDAVREPFAGFYQVDRYVMPAPGGIEPLRAIRVRSHIVSPAPGTDVPAGRHLIRGYAWSGEAPIARVEVSIDGGETWQDAWLASREERYAWRRWEYLWDTGAGLRDAVILSRAYDAAGNTQPDEPEWNRLGYANNAVQRMAVRVVSRES